MARTPDLRLPPQVIRDREVPPPEKLAELRERGPVSAQIADAYIDQALDDEACRERRYLVKVEAIAATVTQPSLRVTGCVGNRTVNVSDVHVDDRGMLVCTVTHRDLPERYPDGTPVNPFGFQNPPVMVGDGTFSEVTVEVGGRPRARQVENVREDPAEAFRLVVRDAVAAAFARLKA